MNSMPGGEERASPWVEYDGTGLRNTALMLKMIESVRELKSSGISVKHLVF
jgi:hypothetical protein